MPAAKLDSTKELSVTIVSKANEKVSFEFFCVPQLAADLIGEIRIDWSDGRVNSVDCAITDGALTEMVNNPQQTAENISHYLFGALQKIMRKEVAFLLDSRYNKFRKIGEFDEGLE